MIEHLTMVAATRVHFAGARAPYRSHIANPHPFPQACNFVLICRDELLPHETGVTGFYDGFHDGGVVNFLAAI